MSLSLMTIKDATRCRYEKVYETYHHVLINFGAKATLIPRTHIYREVADLEFYSSYETVARIINTMTLAGYSWDKSKERIIRPSIRRR